MRMDWWVTTGVLASSWQKTYFPTFRTVHCQHRFNHKSVLCSFPASMLDGWLVLTCEGLVQKAIAVENSQMQHRSISRDAISLHFPWSSGSCMLSAARCQWSLSLGYRGCVAVVSYTRQSLLLFEIWRVVVPCKLPHLLQKEASLMQGKLLGHDQLEWYFQCHSLSPGA